MSYEQCPACKKDITNEDCDCVVVTRAEAEKLGLLRPELPLVDIIAEVCHEANRAFCKLHGDESHATWANTPDGIQQSAKNGIQHVFDNPKVTAEDLYNEWRAYKLNDGWTYGPVKDVAQKTHPNLHPDGYAALTPVEKAKDYLFLGITKSLMEAFGGKG